MGIRNSSFVKEFKEFINKGSVMDLAIGMVIGAAFSKIVSSLVADIIMPVVGLIGGGIDFTDLVITIPNFFGGDTAAHIYIGVFLQNVVDFLIVALTLFIVIRGLNRMKERAAKKLGKEEEKKEEKEDKKDADTDKILKDILKELKKQNKR
ncbi:large conductance mechanosensitive channel protein MscL [Candidatus Saccharibacteria bacterium]|nr:large conductance mechanosensitive channel protein MscL [Candidatus Saccharibacteria bacterium]MBQ3306359.1 large conductance mechanosensitive channel protein MscL [Candidatus Saccharibacteria bacterium]